jgi:flagellar hook assembly protein FlgD
VPAIEDHYYDAEVVRFALGPVSPNPFRGSALISYSAAKAATVSIEIFDVSGRLVKTVQSGLVDAGTHQATWDGTDSAGSKVARGVYFCRMNAGEFSATEKLIVLQ